jgi:hypothetical protein
MLGGRGSLSRGWLAAGPELVEIDPPVLRLAVNWFRAAGWRL